MEPFMPLVDDLVLFESHQCVSRLTCSLCFQIFKDPIPVDCCGTVYCKGCMQEWMNKNCTCPNCLIANVQVGSAPIRPIIDAVGALEVCCPHARAGCSYTFQYSELCSHLAHCSFAIIDCPFACIGCAQPRHARHLLQEHLLQNEAEHARLVKKFKDDQQRQQNELKERLQETKEELRQEQEQSNRLREQLVQSHSGQPSAACARQTQELCLEKLPCRERKNLLGARENDWGLTKFEPGLGRTRAGNRELVQGAQPQGEAP